MKLVIFLLFLSASLILFRCILYTYKIKTDISREIRRLLIAACGASLAQGISTVVPSVEVSHAFFGLSMVFFNCTVITFARYTMLYTNSKVVGRLIYYITLVGALFDAGLILWNIRSGLFFTTESVILPNGESVFSINPGAAYYTRWTAIITLASLCCFLLLYRAATSPHIYRAKYLCIVGAVTIPICIFALSNLKHLPIDFTTVTFAIAGGTIFYFTLIHSPREVLSRAHSRVISGMEDPVVTLDYNGCYIGMNEAAQYFFKQENNDKDPVSAEIAVNTWLAEHNIALEDNYGSINLIDYKEDGKVPIYINVKTQIIYDERGGRVGYFVQIHDYTIQEKRRQRDWYAATHDSLTGLLNRSAFMEFARALIEDYPNRNYVIVCSDIENFKLVNDIFGENYGDEMLKNLSELFGKIVRPDEYLGRLGNDIFAFIIEKKYLDPDRLIGVSRELIPEDMRLSLQVHIQYGVYEVIEPSTPVNIMCERALIAIKNVKGRLEDAVVYYDDKLREDTLEEQELISEIEPAIDRGEFVFFLQPQVSSEGKILGGEALVRWHHPVKGLVPPGKFITILEKKGLIPKLDRCIWEQACAKLKEWKDMGRDDLYISVNISPRDFYYLDVYQTFVDLVKKYDIDSKNLRLEITETAVMQNLTEQIRLIDNVRSAGFVVEMDDFGSGYSSLNTLKDIHMDILKIDMGFLGDGIGNERSRTILEIVVDLAKRLNMPTVIEGVEHVEEVEFLKTIGCDVFQGYFFAKPMEVSDFEDKYMKKGKDMTA